jgi:hypothetical protein
MTASQLAEIASMTKTEMLAIAYVEAADGDVGLALRQALEDRLVLEEELEVARSLTSTNATLTLRAASTPIL